MIANHGACTISVSWYYTDVPAGISITPSAGAAQLGPGQSVNFTIGIDVDPSVAPATYWPEIVVEHSAAGCPQEVCAQQAIPVIVDQFVNALWQGDFEESTEEDPGRFLCVDPECDPANATAVMLQNDLPCTPDPSGRFSLYIDGLGTKVRAWEGLRGDHRDHEGAGGLDCV